MKLVPLLIHLFACGSFIRLQSELQLVLVKFGMIYVLGYPDLLFQMIWMTKAVLEIR
jgi:hypothetical protein